MAFLISIGEPLFRLLLTEKWLPAVPYLQLLCLYGMMFPLLQISYNLYKVFKKGILLLMIDSFRHFLLIISIIFTIQYGIELMLIGQIIVTFIISLLNLYMSGALINYSLFDQLKKIIPYYFTSGLIGFVVYKLPKFNSDLLTICF